MLRVDWHQDLEWLCKLKRGLAQHHFVTALLVPFPTCDLMKVEFGIQGLEDLKFKNFRIRAGGVVVHLESI